MDGGILLALLLVALTVANAPEEEASGALLLRALQLGALLLMALTLGLQLWPAPGDGSGLWVLGAGLTAALCAAAVMMVFAPGWRHWLARLLQVRGRATFRADSLRHSTALLLLTLMIADALLRARDMAGPVDPWDLRALFMTMSVLLMVAILGVGFPLRRGWTGTCARLGLWLPGRREVLLAAGLGVALMAGASLLWLLWTLVSRPELAEDARLPAPGLLTALLSAAMAAMGEETLFRGALQPLFGVALTSAGFALVHLRPGAEFAFVPLLGVALVFAWLRERQGTLAAVCAHFCYNFTLSLSAPLYGV